MESDGICMCTCMQYVIISKELQCLRKNLVKLKKWIPIVYFTPCSTVCMVLEIYLRFHLSYFINIWMKTFLWQVSLLAYDQGFPSLVSVQALLIVNILRNQNPPVFINEPYSATISQNQGTFLSIITVTARDADVTVSRPLRSCFIIRPLRSCFISRPLRSCFNYVYIHVTCKPCNLFCFCVIYPQENIHYYT